MIAGDRGFLEASETGSVESREQKCALDLGASDGALIFERGEICACGKGPYDEWGENLVLAFGIQAALNVGPS
jgi:hypothetical protein